MSEDERNEAVVQESRARGTDDVVREFHESFAAFVAGLRTLSDDELNEADRFEGMAERIPGWRPWRVLYDPGHLEEHGRAIQEAFASRRSAPTR